jgi:uncharacterized Zn-binding protein involved in type VI secretion
MPGIVRGGIDTAGGGIISGGIQTFVTVEGGLWIVVGDSVASHGSGPHVAAVMNQGSTFIKINSIAACLAGHTATCGHTATGSANMRGSE